MSKFENKIKKKPEVNVRKAIPSIDIQAKIKEIVKLRNGYLGKRSQLQAQLINNEKGLIECDAQINVLQKFLSVKEVKPKSKMDKIVREELIK